MENNMKEKNRRSFAAPFLSLSNKVLLPFDTLLVVGVDAEKKIRRFAAHSTIFFAFSLKSFLAFQAKWPY